MEKLVVMRLIVSCVVVVAALWAPGVSAQEPPAKRFIVLSLDQSATTDGLTSGLAASLKQRGYQVELEPQARTRAEEARVKRPDPEVFARFSGVQARIGDGINEFFYEGHGPAIDALRPVVDLAIKHLEVLSYRPDLAENIYEAASVLLRSYEEAKDKQNLKALAGLMARYFPHRLPLTKTIPPETIAFVEAERAQLAAQRTSLTLQLVNPVEGCRAYLNGMEIMAEVMERPIQLDAQTPYHLRMDCGQPEPLVWRLKPRAGQSLRVPLADRDPLSVKLKDGSFESRDRVEQAIRAAAYWTDADTIIGVSKSVVGASQDGALLVRVERGKSAIWSDGADEAAIRRLLPRILPELGQDGVAMAAPDDGAAATAPAADAGVSWDDVWPWGSLVLGAGGLGAGAYLLWSANGEALNIACTRGTLAGADCADATRYTGEPSAKLDDRSAVVTQRRVIGGVAAGIGLGLVGLGVWGLVSDGEGEGASLSFTPLVGGAAVQLGWSF
jgi:hypothetical protein